MGFEYAVFYGDVGGSIVWVSSGGSFLWVFW